MSDVEFEISWTVFPDLAPLWPRVPRLEELTLFGTFPNPILRGIDLPRLKTLVIQSCGTASENVRAIAEAHWPALETLELWFGDPHHGFSGGIDDVLALLRADMPQLHTLRLMNASFTDEIVEPLASSSLLPRLREVSLALGTLTDEGAALLVRHIERFAHLDVLDLEDNCLDDDDLVANIAREVRIGDQKDPEEERYVSLLE